MSSGANVTLYPCDNGEPKGLTRGWHIFVANDRGVICCTRCGKRPAANYPPIVSLSNDEIETALRKVPNIDLHMDEYDLLARSVGAAMDAGSERESAGAADD